MSPETTNDPMRKSYRKLTEQDQSNMQELKSHGHDLHAFLDRLGTGREISLAKTKVEEAIMWGTKAITA